MNGGAKFVSPQSAHPLLCPHVPRPNRTTRHSYSTNRTPKGVALNLAEEAKTPVDGASWMGKSDKEIGEKYAFTGWTGCGSGSDTTAHLPANILI